MKLKKILSSVVALAMAVTTLTAFTTSANAKTTSANILDEAFTIASWDVPVVVAKADITAEDIATTGADAVIIAGDKVTGDYYEFMVQANGVRLYQEKINGPFEVEVPLFGNYDLEFTGNAVEITSIKFVDSDANVSLTRGSQEAVISAPGANDTVLATGVDLGWSGAEGITVSGTQLSGLRFDGTESFVFTSTGTGNIQIQDGNWSGVIIDGGIWTAGDKLIIPITQTYVDGINAIGTAPGVELQIVDYGTKAIRYILKVAEDDVDEIESVSLKFRNDFDYSEAFETSKCYRSIKANGQTISEDGYVFITFVVNNVPGNFSFDEAIFSFDGERAATLVG
ncbi:MAG: hypothetical protein E7509_03190 [Ruminococcus sp.]|nr:hypothetical protein [Ruminococcus sp.]